MAVSRILIVDDEPRIAEPLMFALEREHFAVDHVPLGQQALEHLASRVFDLVVLDVGLPDLNGFDVLKQLRQSSQVPVLFLTARQDEVDRILGLELGGDDYVTKPFSPREVVARIRAILKRLAPHGDACATDLWKLDEAGAQIFSWHRADVDPLRIPHPFRAAETSRAGFYPVAIAGYLRQ